MIPPVALPSVIAGLDSSPSGSSKANPNYGAGICVSFGVQLKAFGGCFYSCEVIKNGPWDPYNVYLGITRIPGKEIDAACRRVSSFCPLVVTIEADRFHMAHDPTRGKRRTTLAAAARRGPSGSFPAE